MEKRNLGKLSLKLLEYTSNDHGKKKRKSKTKLRILRVLCQRPFFTGSGIHFINLLKQTELAKIKQALVFGQPAGEDNTLHKIINEENIFPVDFYNKNYPERDSLPYHVAGMSDQMPYASTKFSNFTEEILESYLLAFKEKIEEALQKFKPTIIHTHHLWLISALCRVICPDLPVISTCHNTALRQLYLAPHLTQFIINPIKNIDIITVQNEFQKRNIIELYKCEENANLRQKIIITGQAINTDIFYPPPQGYKIHRNQEQKIIYIGKLSHSKGVPQLIEAFKILINQIPNKIELFIVGSGKGEEKKDIKKRASDFKDRIHFLGQLDQPELAKILHKCQLFVLPSFYDGFPKVLLEALASGCKCIITDLPGIKDTIKKLCGEDEGAIFFIPLPKMKSIDKPLEIELPKFIENLTNAMRNALSIEYRDNALKLAEIIREEYGWEGLFQKYLTLYLELIRKK